MDEIKMVELGKQYEEVVPDMAPAPQTLLRSGMYIGGFVVEQFETAWAEYCGTNYAIGTSSGTAALTASFAALIKQWCPVNLTAMRIITQANTFVATANAALRIPYLQVDFIDCDDYFGMDVASLQQLLDRDAHRYSINIVVPVHMYGIMCDMQSILALANKHENVYVVEDASHAHGSRDISGRLAGSYGDLSAFSMFPAKPLGACGDAGAVVTNREQYADFVRSYCDVGRGESWDVFDKVGFTYRLDAIQATILKAKLRYLDAWRERREQIAKFYFERWKSIEEIRLPYPRPTMKGTAWYAFPIRLQKQLRRELQNCLFVHSIPYKRYYPQVTSAVRWVDAEPRVNVATSIHTAKRISDEVLCLPIHEFLTDDQVKYIADKVRHFFIDRAQPVKKT